MRIPDSLASLAEYGIIEEVLRPLMSGKEAQIYLVVSGGQQRVAKVYKEAQNRTFKNRAEYTEGRKVRNTRDQRAMGKGSKHGRAQEEAAWRATEVEMIYRLRDAGVRVPIPYHFIDSVLVMEMITDAEGNPAPRLGDLHLEPEEARAIFDRLLAEVVRMLSTGVVHGDLSDFNVLVGTDGPVIIDFPQAVDASSNANARKLLVRDVDNLHRFMARFVPDHRALPYAQEMWQLYERSALAPDAKLIGRHRPSEQKANTQAVLDLIGDAEYDERRRRQSMGMKGRGGPQAARPEQTPARGAQQQTPQHTTPPRRVEVVMNAPQQRANQGAHRAHAGQQPRHRDARATHAAQTRPERDARATHVAQPRPERDGRAPHAAQQRAQQRPERDARTTHATQPRPERDARATHATQSRPERDVRAPHAAQPRPERDARTAHAAQPRPERDARTAHAAQPRPVTRNEPGVATAAGVEGAQKRRRRRRRRKPTVDAPKTPG